MVESRHHEIKVHCVRMILHETVVIMMINAWLVVHDPVSWLSICIMYFVFDLGEASWAGSLPPDWQRRPRFLWCFILHLTSVLCSQHTRESEYNVHVHAHAHVHVHAFLHVCTLWVANPSYSNTYPNRDVTLYIMFCTCSFARVHVFPIHLQYS